MNQPARTSTSLITRALLIIFPAFVFFFLFKKIYFIERFFGASIGCQGCFIYPVLKHDGVIFAACLFFYWLSTCTRTIALTAFIRLVIVFITLVYILDYFVLRNFITHLFVEDVFKYAPFAGSFIINALTNMLTPLEGAAVILAAIIFLLSTAAFLTHRSNRQPAFQRGILIGSVLLAALYWMPEKQEYVHSWVYKNVFEYNLQTGVNVAYSVDSKARIKKKGKQLLTQSCRDKTPVRKNIVVVAVESLSMYHSRYFSGLSDITPELDRIAQDNISFMNFYANGYTTEHGLIALLLGRVPVPSPYEDIYAQELGLNRFFNDKHSLAYQLRQLGYTPEFLTTGNLKFSNKGRWLKSIGFNYVEGHDHPLYKKWKRYHFDAAPDEALYQRASERIFKTKRDKPYFLFIETVSTHHPFIDPVTKTHSENGAITYADQQLGLFYDTLKKGKFFDSGILIIVSDHRSMTPLKSEEVELYGTKAQARIPLVVALGEVEETVDQPFQQIDTYASILNLVSDKACSSIWQGDFLNTPRVSPEVIFHVPGNDRNIVHVFTKEGEGRVHLKGDDTFMESDDIAQEDQRLMVDKINYDRLFR